MPTPNLLKKLVLAVTVMTLSAAAFWPGVRNGFVWDDYPYIVQNPLVRDFSAAGLKRIFTTVHFGLYKPVAIASFALNYKFAALDPAPYHVTNILLHSVNAGLVFLLIFLLRKRWCFNIRINWILQM